MSFDVIKLPKSSIDAENYTDGPDDFDSSAPDDDESSTYEGDDFDDDVSSAGDSELPPSSPPDTGAFPDNW